MWPLSYGKQRQLDYMVCQSSLLYGANISPSTWSEVSSA